MESSRTISPEVQILRGWADDIDFAGKRVLVEGVVEKPQPAEQEAEGGKVETVHKQKFWVPYDKVVIAVGCYAQTFGVPGVKEHAFFLKDVADARRIRRRILERFEEAWIPTVPEERKRELLHFAIVGGGPTGIEFSAELHDLLTEDLTRLYPGLEKYTRITVFDVAPTILGMFDVRLQEYARGLFRRQDIHVRTSHNVLEVKEECIVTKEEGCIPVGAVVWSTGLAKNPFVSGPLAKPFSMYPEDPNSKPLSILKNVKSEQIRVDNHLRVLVEPAGTSQEGRPHPQNLDNSVFALGDCASVDSGPLPATAQVANRAASWLAKTLNKAAKERQGSVVGIKPGELVDITTQVPFSFKSMGIMAYLGGWRAITQLDGNTKSVNIKGRLAWFMWRTAYLSSSVSWRNRILIPTMWYVCTVTIHSEVLTVVGSSIGL